LGPYTVGALLSFAFHQRAAAVDGNVVRVLARCFAIADDTCRSPVRKRLWEIAEDILPQEEPWLVVEGLIELGATVCTKTPRCPVCPLRDTCQAFRLGKQNALPLRKKQKPIIHLMRHVAVVHYEGNVLLKRVAKGEVMADLYEFPYFEDPAAMAPHFPFAIVFERELEEQAHTFTRYRAVLRPILWKATEKKELADYIWVSWEKMHQLPFSSGHKRIRDTL
jgi:A/G-specific adenine glycosylase